MGCWGITAFESDAGLDAAGFIRKHLPEDGRLELGNMIAALRQDEWNVPPEPAEAGSHTSPMALAEIMVRFLNRNAGSLDHTGAWAWEENKFSAVTSFTASREDVKWLRDYLADTLKYSMQHAEKGEKWSGWFQKEDWKSWQNHMAMLIGRLDGVLAANGNLLELFSGNQEAAGETMCTQGGAEMKMG